MSTPTTESFRGLPAASASIRPDLACIGYVSEVYEPKLTAAGVYLMQGLRITALEGGKSVNVNLLYRPEWLQPGFEPDALKEITDEDPKDGKPIGPKMHFVYQKNINSLRGPHSLLRGVCGSEERFRELSSALLSLEEPTLETVAEVFTTFFADPFEIGYTLTQQRIKDHKNADGKWVYLYEDRMEVKDYWDLTAAEVKKVVANAKRNNGQPKITFDAEGF